MVSQLTLTPSCILGALYSRKITLDGEQVSLQVQDTPCVALQVKGHNHLLSCSGFAHIFLPF